MVDKILKIAARIFSNVLHPLLMPTIGIALWVTHCAQLDLSIPSKLIIISATFFYTAIIPVAIILVLYYLELISTVALEKRAERRLPYCLTIVSYLVCATFFLMADYPLSIVAFVLGAIASLITATTINRWWKISAHAAGMGGLIAVAMALYITQSFFTPYLLVVILLLTGALATARIILGRHTLGQVLAGALNGFIWVFLFLFLSTLK